MKYFDTFPFVTTADNKGNYTQLVNLTLRSKLIPQLSRNPLLFYKYAIQEGDTPEIIANKYYGDPYRYWMILIANEIADPQWEWPLSTQQFTKFIIDKYADAAGNQSPIDYTQVTIHHYEKLITTYDDSNQTTVIKNIVIDEDTYNHTVETTKQARFDYGGIVTYTVTKKAVSIFDYENELNEKKRNIKLINANYITDIENQFKYLMNL